MTVNQDMMAKLGQYMASRAIAREERADAAIELMTPYERRLVREAAVMGYVRGSMAGRDACAKENYPGDTQIMRLVLGCSEGMPDLYPIVAALMQGLRPEHPEFDQFVRSAMGFGEDPDGDQDAE